MQASAYLRCSVLCEHGALGRGRYLGGPKELRTTEEIPKKNNSLRSRGDSSLGNANFSVRVSPSVSA